MNIIDILHSQFRPLFKNLSTWAAWEVYLRAIFGLGIDDAKDRKLFRDCTGLERRARTGGKDLVTHYQGGHDDLTNAAAGACVRVQKAKGSGVRIWSVSWGGPEGKPAFDISGRLIRNLS